MKNITTSVGLSLQVRNSYRDEVETFETSTAFSEMLERVSNKVGFPLETEEARILWNTCRCSKFSLLFMLV